MLSAAFYMAWRFFMRRKEQRLIVYSRNVTATAVALLLRFFVRKKKIPIIYEAHSLMQQPKWLFHFVLRHCDLVVAISQALQQDLRSFAQNITVLPDAVRQELMASSPMTRGQARTALALPERFQKVVVYTGSLKPGKGVSIFLHAAAHMGEEVLFILVGGDASLQPSRHSGAHLLCVGFVPPQQVRLYQCAADVLVLPNTKEGSIHRYTSPLKLFEYMAANRPIVASDMPVLREVLQNGVNALLTPPGDVDALAAAITRLLENDELARQLADHAYRQVAALTWEHRAEQIINYVKSLS